MRKPTSKELKYWKENLRKDYLQAFVDNFHDDEIDITDFREMNEMYEFSDYYFLSFNEIEYCVDNEIESGKLIEFNDYCVDNYHVTQDFPNFQSWLKGCPSKLEDSRYWNRNLRIVESIKKQAVKEWREQNEQKGEKDETRYN